MGLVMKRAAPRKPWKRAQTPPPLRGRPVVQKTTSTGKLKTAIGIYVRQEFLGRGGILMENTTRLGRTTANVRQQCTMTGRWQGQVLKVIILGVMTGRV